MLIFQWLLVVGILFLRQEIMFHLSSQEWKSDSVGCYYPVSKEGLFERAVMTNDWLEDFSCRLIYCDFSERFIAS